VKNPHPTSDFQVIDIATSGLGLKSQLAIENPGVWLGSGVGWAFHRHNLAEVIRRAILPCCHLCQSIPQLRIYGTESHRRQT
jgi:hypothetical protein